MLDLAERTLESIRWMPRAKMPADRLTKADPVKSSGDLKHLRRTGVFRPVQGTAELQERAGDSALKPRSQATAQGRLSRGPVQG